MIPATSGSRDEPVASVERREADDEAGRRERGEVVLAEERRLAATGVLREADEPPDDGDAGDERR